jgi:hypothetical protein
VRPTLPTRVACLSGAQHPSSATPRKIRTRRSAARSVLVGDTDRSPSPSTRPSFRRRWAAAVRRTPTRKRKKVCSFRRSRARVRTVASPVRPASTLDSRRLGPSNPGGGSRDLLVLRRHAGRPRLPESMRQLRPRVLLPLRHHDRGDQRRRTDMRRQIIRCRRLQSPPQRTATATPLTTRLLRPPPPLRYIPPQAVAPLFAPAQRRGLQLSRS